MMTHPFLIHIYTLSIFLLFSSFSDIQCHDLEKINVIDFPLNSIYRVAGDGNGNAYFIGDKWGGPVIYDLPNIGAGDVIIGKVNSSGLVWVDLVGTTDDEYGGGVAAHGETNSVYFCGNTYDPFAGTYNGGGDYFIMKYDTNGTMIWKTQNGSNEFQYLVTIVVDPSGDYVYAEGWDFISGEGDVDILVKYTSSGDFVWYKVVTGYDSNSRWNRDIFFTNQELIFAYDLTNKVNIIKYSAGDGVEQYSILTDEGFTYSHSCIDDEYIYITGRQANTYLMKRSIADGSEIWVTIHEYYNDQWNPKIVSCSGDYVTLAIQDNSIPDLYSTAFKKSDGSFVKAERQEIPDFPTLEHACSSGDIGYAMGPYNDGSGHTGFFVFNLIALLPKCSPNQYAFGLKASRNVIYSTYYDLGDGIIKSVLRSTEPWKLGITTSDEQYPTFTNYTILSRDLNDDFEVTEDSEWKPYVVHEITSTRTQNLYGVLISEDQVSGILLKDDDRVVHYYKVICDFAGWIWSYQHAVDLNTYTPGISDATLKLVEDFNALLLPADYWVQLD